MGIRLIHGIITMFSRHYHSIVTALSQRCHGVVIFCFIPSLMTFSHLIPSFS
ncbi:hypothetical protein CLOBOL_03000 [Enterocloster bolteae ATCC BAA-613]|uniref:Uncharacterized protein n=1 Tax=Enterocloster bolteae (strain ATCC BAA-613 / DSM 15670 / CCUG 46953 / JCM 12243 / WAL 16351) TaxID=411902 RepID=A8RRH1_ENTBW|nr:hypothetical protein CLOBOL_03000 [Enterocloster bolteae ATCC BAA-613]